MTPRRAQPRSRFERVVAGSAAVLLLAGLLRTGAGLARQYIQLFTHLGAVSATATTDQLVRPVGLYDGNVLVTGVASAGWPSADEVTVVAPVSAFTAADAAQFQRVASYLLYPRRVWLIQWCDPSSSDGACPASAARDIAATLHARQARHVIALGPALPLKATRTLTLSPLVHLVEL